MEGMFKKQLFIISLAFFIIPFSSQGAILYFSPETSEHGKGDVFKVDVMADSEGDSINACEAEISFDRNKAEVIDISTGGSILSLWPEAPRYYNDQGRILLTGGMPGGFKGQGKVVSVVFKAIGPGQGFIIFDEGSRILMNDGNGTVAELEKRSASFAVSSAPGGDDQWGKELSEDKNPPRPFKIKKGSDPAIFEGKYFISFSATDRETGIAYYQVKEGSSDWVTADSPYLLENQDPSQEISVRAVDKAGNERIEKYSRKKNLLYYFELITLAIAFFVALRIFLRDSYLNRRGQYPGY